MLLLMKQERNRRYIKGFFHLFLASILLNLNLATPDLAADSYSLPHSSETYVIPSSKHAIANKLLKIGKRAVPKLEDKDEKELIELFPSIFTDVCQDMSSHGGFESRIFGVMSDKYAKYLLTAFICNYRDPSWTDQRLGIFIFKDDTINLTMVRHNDDSDPILLSKLQSFEKLRIADTLGAVFEFHISGDHPCCAGPSSYQKRTIVYCTFENGKVNQVVAMPIYEQHIMDGLDTQESKTYTSNIGNITDSKGSVIQIKGDYSIIYDNYEGTTSRHEGLINYQWNAKSKIFENMVKTK